ncbi:Uncharacterised protein [Mycobacteroides abscessus subsp. abscessus]|nr:Uncharacterised protein [Mycobacteroides abscessus subsp. abscessus]SKV38760.1 Uncharacterised protein [Mycobacteroides abscessus subsp. abscessus]
MAAPYPMAEIFSWPVANIGSIRNLKLSWLSE